MVYASSSHRGDVAISDVNTRSSCIRQTPLRQIRVFPKNTCRGAALRYMIDNLASAQEHSGHYGARLPYSDIDTRYNVMYILYFGFANSGDLLVGVVKVGWCLNQFMHNVDEETSEANKSTRRVPLTLGQGCSRQRPHVDVWFPVVCRGRVLAFGNDRQTAAS